MGVQRQRGVATALAALAAAVVVAPATAATGRIFNLAGAGFTVGPGGVAIAPPTGDGGPAGLARLSSPTAVAATRDGGYLIAETERHRVRRVSPRGVITTVAGTGRGGFSGDGGPATAARIMSPSGVAELGDGSVVIADQRNNRVRLVDPAGVITTLAAVVSPDGVAPAADGGVLVVQDFENRVIHIDRDGAITAVAGTGGRGFAGDGGPATAARLSRPQGVAAAADGGVLIADGNRVRRVAPDGVITTIAGDGATVPSGDGGPATAAGVPRPAAVAETADGAVIIASVNQIRRVGRDGVITTLSGTGQGNVAGDGGPARRAVHWLPQGVAAPVGGGILVAEQHAGRIRFIDAAAAGPVAGATVERPFAVSFARGIQPGEVGFVTRIRVACPPRQVPLRFALSRAATVSLVVTRAGRTVARRSGRLAAGAHTFRVRVARPGDHRVRLTAVSATGQRADDLAVLTVASR